jgi:hypothetical protein
MTHFGTQMMKPRSLNTIDNGYNILEGVANICQD